MAYEQERELVRSACADYLTQLRQRLLHLYVEQNRRIMDQVSSHPDDNVYIRVMEDVRLAQEQLQELDDKAQNFETLQQEQQKEHKRQTIIGRVTKGVGQFVTAVLLHRAVGYNPMGVDVDFSPVVTQRQPCHTYTPEALQRMAEAFRDYPMQRKIIAELVHFTDDLLEAIGQNDRTLLRCYDELMRLRADRRKITPFAYLENVMKDCGLPQRYTMQELTKYKIQPALAYKWNKHFGKEVAGAAQALRAS